jgi:triacylglycerol esterase/lipase EstA (alpha/beta hydrolase family)
MFSFLGDLFSIYFTIALFYSCLHACVTHLIYLMETRLGYWQDPSQLCPSSMALLRNAIIEALCNFTRFILLPFSSFRANPNAITTDAPVTPILLVHGYAQNQSDWFWFQYQLKQAGIGPVYTINLWNITGGIEAHAEKLAKSLQTIKEKHPNEPITLIGHSMGGLVSSYYAEFLKKDDIQIKKIITLGSPFYGTRLAGLGMGLSVEQMAPNSAFLEALRLKIDGSTIPYYYLASQMDNTIVPWDSALIDPLTPDASNQYVIPDQGHLRLLVSQQVFEKVKAWLA